MVPGAYYGSLAASASIFVGILTAYLVNDLMNKLQGRRRAQLRIDQNEARLETLRSQENRFQEDIQDIEAQWEDERREQARQDVERFMDRRVGSYDFRLPVENLSRQTLLRELADFLGFEGPEMLNEYHEMEVNGRSVEIREEMRSSVVEEYARDMEDSDSYLSLEEFIDGFKERHGIDDLEEQTRSLLDDEHRERIMHQPTGLGRLLDSTIMGGGLEFEPPTPPEIVGANIAADATRSAHEQRVHFQLQQKLIETQFEIQYLSDERSRLINRIESINSRELWWLLGFNLITIIASVVIPTLAYLIISGGPLYIGDFVIENLPVEFVTILWFVGLVLVIGVLARRIAHQFSADGESSA